MLFSASVPITAAIPIVIEPGKLAGLLKTGKTKEVGASALPAMGSFQTRLQTILALDARKSLPAESDLYRGNAVSDSQKIASRSEAPVSQFLVARPAAPVSQLLAARPEEPRPPVATVLPRLFAVKKTGKGASAAVEEQEPPKLDRTPVPPTASSPRILPAKSAHPSSHSDPSSSSISSGTPVDVAPSPQALVALPLALDPRQPARVENDPKSPIGKSTDEAKRTEVGVNSRASTAVPPMATRPEAPAGDRPITSRVPADLPTASAPPAATAELASNAPQVEQAPESLQRLETNHSPSLEVSPEVSATPASKPPEGPAVKSQPGPAAAAKLVSGSSRANTTPSAPAQTTPEAQVPKTKSEEPARSSNAPTSPQLPPAAHIVASQAAPTAHSGAVMAHAPALVTPRESDSSLSAAGFAHADTFAALDAEFATPRATWTHAGATRAEAGYLDPSLGWIGVRAGVESNTIHASIVPASTEAAQALGSHLESLNSYLAEHHVMAAELTIATPQSGQYANPESGFNTSGQQPGQGQRGDQPSTEARPDSTLLRSQNASPASRVAGLETPIAAPDWSGGHISLIA